jgi:hypothetical protein
MTNQLFQSLNGNGNLNSQFQNFMQQMQGRNPHEEIARLLQTGRVSQQQLNQAQQMAQQIQAMLGNMKK